MLEICAIASGSNGNCYYIGNEKDAIIVDAGISGKQIIQRMVGCGLDPAKVKGVFISHEHSDHMSGVRGIVRKLQAPVYLSERTYRGAYRNIRPSEPRFFTPGDKILLSDFTIHTFLKNHDASEPCSFRIEYNGWNIGVMTDIGSVTKEVISHAKKCDGLFLESNYDEKMLWEGPYPFFLKRRVASEMGHLSNDQAFELLENHSGSNLQVVFLSHISKENNTPEMAVKRMSSLSGEYMILPTSRFEPGEVYTFHD